MLEKIAGAFFVLLTMQGTPAPRVNRIFVTTPYNASIIYEYANSAIHEDEPINQGTVECIASQLRATGLFSDIQITLKPVSGNKVDVDIAPVWSNSRDEFVVSEITTEGFNGLDEKELLKELGQRGLKPGVPLLKYPLPKIREMVIESIRDIHRYDHKSMNEVEERLSELSFRLTLLSPRSTRLVLTTIRNPICG